MSRRASDDDDLLEPIPVYDEPVTRVIDDRPSPAVETSLQESWHPVSATARAGGWTEAAGDRQLAEARARSFPAKFLRMVDLAPARLPSALQSWWRDVSREGSVELGRRMHLDRPQCKRGGTWSLPGRMRSGVWFRRVPVEVMLWPHLGLWTKVSIEPLAGVRLSRAYFSHGHRLLDELSGALVAAGSAVGDEPTCRHPGR